MRVLRLFLVVGVAGVIALATPSVLAACSSNPDFPPEWARDLNRLRAYRLAVGSGVLALVVALLAVRRGRMPRLAWVPVALFAVHPAWLVPPSDNGCIDRATTLSQLWLVVGGVVLLTLVGQALDERARRRRAAAERAV